MGTHDDRVREQFRIQAATFTDTGFATSSLDRIMEILAPRAGEQALDVACGAGHLGRALAPHLAHVTGVDLTPEMLAQGDRLAAAGGLRNVAFAVGDATALPWLDAQFDLVACRITLHQVADPAAVVREMVRVTRPDGRIGITDMILDEAAPADENTRLERLRDPSHGRTLTRAEIDGLLADAGARVVRATSWENPIDAEDWMERTQTPETDRDEIRRRFADEIAGGSPTGLRPGHDPRGALTLTHVWGTVVAARADAAVPRP